MIKPGLYRLTAGILLALMSVAFLLILAGFILGISRMSNLTGTISLGEIITGVSSFDPVSVMAAGIGMLFIIPILLLINAMIYFFKTGDKLLSWITLVVLVFLSLSAFLALS